MQITSLQENTIYYRQRGRCKYCFTKLNFDEMILTYKVPLSRRGKDNMENLIAVCPSCYDPQHCLMTNKELQRKRKRLRERHKKRIKNITLKQRILDKTNGLCTYCGTELTLESLTVDHIIPIFRGGENDLDNLVPACWDCNTLKASMTLEEFNTINESRRESARKKIGISFRAIVSIIQRFFHKRSEKGVPR